MFRAPRAGNVLRLVRRTQSRSVLVGTARYAVRAAYQRRNWEIRTTTDALFRPLYGAGTSQRDVPTTNWQP